MNLNTLEKVARQAMKGGDVAEKSNAMLKSGFITPTEHRSLNSLSFQIAANMKANGAAEGVYAKKNETDGWWM
jgi:hypothetical protein